MANFGPLTTQIGAKFTMSKSCVLLYWQRHCTPLQLRASAKLCGVKQGMKLRNFRRGRHLYSAGRPSVWAPAHILVEIIALSAVVSTRWLVRYITPNCVAHVELV